jgi:hypothetical protein
LEIQCFVNKALQLQHIDFTTSNVAEAILQEERVVRVEVHVGLAAILVGAAVLVAGCSSLPLPSIRFDPPFGGGDWVEAQDSTVIRKPSAALAANFLNLRDQEISVRIEIDQVDGGNDCMDIFRLGPKEKTGYFCRQASLSENAEYRFDLRVYDDLGDTNLVEHIQRMITLESNEQGVLVMVGRPMD